MLTFFIVGDLLASDWGEKNPVPPEKQTGFRRCRPRKRTETEEKVPQKTPETRRSCSGYPGSFFLFFCVFCAFCEKKPANRKHRIHRRLIPR
ncbi:MAG: hypothetical protein J7576_21915, partial [Siphonobacter aquaeclarae]|nr:hypothetical protein [Siphonobacter aquaeclarae]